MSSIFIDAVAVAAPGMASWSDAQPILRGERPYTATPLSAFTPTLLPANEQRRATATVRLAFRVAEEAIRHSQHAANSLATVFASSDADMMVSHRICTALAQPQRLVSPTDFHNSVHNAPSGYWHIGAHSHKASSAIAGHDYSFAIGLLEALTQVKIEESNTLLVCYDVPAPEPLLERRMLDTSFATALLLSTTRTPNSIATIAIESLHTHDAPTSMSNELLELLRLGNPAARALPLLQLLACKTNGAITLARTAERTLALQLSVL